MLTCIYTEVSQDAHKLTVSTVLSQKMKYFCGFGKNSSFCSESNVLPLTPIVSLNNIPVYSMCHLAMLCWLNLTKHKYNASIF